MTRKAAKQKKLIGTHSTVSSGHVFQLEHMMTEEITTEKDRIEWPEKIGPNMTCLVSYREKHLKPPKGNQHKSGNHSVLHLKLLGTRTASKADSAHIR